MFFNPLDDGGCAVKLSCRQASRLISLKMDRPLTRWEQGKLIMHLWLCNNCRNFSAQMGILRKAARKAGQGE
jgi:predicted anti-sigma-YlaC factor YlaD